MKQTNIWFIFKSCPGEKKSRTSLAIDEINAFYDKEKTIKQNPNEKKRERERNREIEKTN